MNVASYLQQREIGRHGRRKAAVLQDYVESKVTTGFVNKSCNIQRRCRSTFVMECSPDGTKVASTHGDHSVRVTEIATGRCLKTLTGHPRTPWCLAYHPSSSHILASGCLHGQVRIWDLYGHGCEVWQTENTTVIAALTFHPVDHVLVIAAGNTLYFWDWSKPEPFAKCCTAYEFERIRWVKFDSTGSYLYTGISNNTSVHRENVAGTASQSEERSQNGNQSRLGCLYSNIVNCFHEYQRDRLVHQLNPHPTWQPRSRSQLHSDTYNSVPVSIPERARSPLTLPSLNRHQSAVRQNELLMGSYSNLLAERSRNRNSRQGRTGAWPAQRQTDIGSSASSQNLDTEFMLNSNADPFLSDVPLPSDVIELSSVVSERAPVLVERVVEENDTEENQRETQYPGLHRSETENSAIPGDDVLSGPNNPSGNLSESFEGRLGVSCASCVGASRSADYCDNYGQSSTSATGTSAQSMLNSYLSGPPTSQTFRSIRDRLQTSIPLSLDSNPGIVGGPVRVVTSRESNIPQVTVISGSDRSANASVMDNRPEHNSVIYPSVTNQDFTLNQNSSLGRFSSRLLSRLAPRQDPGQTDNCCDNNGAGDTSSQSSSLLESNTRLTNTTRAQSSLYNTAYPRLGALSRHQAETRYRSWPYSTRLRPQPWQSRHGVGSLMGPYLESRGIRSNLSVASSDQSFSTRSSESVSEIVSRIANSLSSSAQPPQTAPRDGQTSSDTESEVSSHLTHSGAYFMPIGNDTSRMGSSTSSCSTSSADRNSNPPRSSVEYLTEGLAGQSSRSSSQSQGQEVELTVDQNDNYSASQMPNANIVSREIRHETQDDNNNSIHFVQPDVNVQPIVLPGQSTCSLSSTLTSTISSCISSLTSSVSVLQSGIDTPSTVTLNSSTVTSSTVCTLPTSVQSSSDALLNSTTSRRPFDQDYVSLRNTFYNMTSQIEREMSDLNRRINALRESFNESMLALRQGRQSYETLGGLLEETASSLPPIPTVLEAVDEGVVPIDRDSEEQTTAAEPSVPLSQPLTLLESSLRSHRWNRPTSNIHDSASAQETAGSEQELGEGEGHSWRSLHRHYLHPHYSSSILDETINRPNNAIQSAINRAIAGAFMGTGEAAVANNIINQTHRIQYWDFSKCDIPNISSSTENIVVPHCKLHNSASCDISQDCSLLATFVPSHQGFPDDNILTVYSLRPESRGQCLYTKSFGPNAISISISPRNNHALVGLAAKRLSWVFTSDQLVAQIYRLEKEGAGENSMKHVKDVMHSCNRGVRSHVSGNSARWLPCPGQGLVYGTNRGDLHLCRPGVKVIVEKTSTQTKQGPEPSDSTGNIRRCLLGRVPWLNYPNPDRISTSTQTHGIRRTASTQTEQDEADQQMVWL